MMKRKSYRLKAGSINNLKLVEEKLAPLQAEEVQVGVKAIGLNFADVFAIWGLYSATPKGSFIPGLEFSGIVEECGSNVTVLKKGDRIMGVCRFGAYTNRMNIDQRYVIALPKDWSFGEGAAFLVQVLTAYYGLVKLGAIEKGHGVLIQSAAGGVGILANRIAKKFGAYTIGAVGNIDKVKFLKEKENYDHVIVRNRNFKKNLENCIGEKELNLVMECIGGNYFQIAYDCMAPMGRMVVYGSARYASPGSRPNYPKLIWYYLNRPKVDPQKMIELNKAIMGFNLIWLYEKADLMLSILEEVIALDLKKPHIGHQFNFNQLVDAIRLFQSGKTVGKVVINIEDI